MKEKVLWDIITWLVLGKQNMQAKQVYCLLVSIMLVFGLLHASICLIFIYLFVITGPINLFLKKVHSDPHLSSNSPGSGSWVYLCWVCAAGHVLLASQNPNPNIIYSVANYRPYLISHIFANRLFSRFQFISLLYIKWKALTYSTNILVTVANLRFHSGQTSEICKS